MSRKIIIGTLILLSFLGGAIVMMNQIRRNSTPPKGYRITVHEITYDVDYYIMDGEYIIFSDEYNRTVEIHKNFATVNEVR